MSTNLTMENFEAVSGSDSLGTSVTDEMALKTYSNSYKPVTTGQVVAISVIVSVGVVAITIGGYTLYKFIVKKKDEKKKEHEDEIEAKAKELINNQMAQQMPVAPQPAPVVQQAPIVAPQPVPAPVVPQQPVQQVAPVQVPQQAPVAPQPAPVQQAAPAPQQAPVVQQELSLQDLTNYLANNAPVNGQVNPLVEQIFNSLSDEEKQNVIAAANSITSQQIAKDAQASQQTTQNFQEVQQPIYNPAFDPQINN